MARDMDKMSMSSMSMMHHWDTNYFIAILMMWVIMMIGMMIPTAIPMILIYAAISRKAEKQGTAIPSTTIFALGYVVMWSLFSVGATMAQWGLDEAALLSPMMVANSPVLGATILMLAGIYQMTPMKDSCLKHCRMPAEYLSQSWRPGKWGAFVMGFEHGAFCIGCCWILMGLLFFGGVMSLLWIAGITLFVLIEKVAPLGRKPGLVSGIILIVAAIYVLIPWV